MSDENDGFDTWVTQAARDYNTPPAETPREGMWERIAAARQAETRAAAAAPAPTRATRAAWTVWAGRGLAAAAVLMMGIAIGRYSNGGAGVAPAGGAGGTSQRGMAETTAALPSPRTDDPASAGGLEPIPSPIPAGVTAKGPRRAGGRREEEAALRRGLDSGAPNGGAFEVATVQHLAQAEALLTAYRLDERAGRLEDARQLAASARDLLSTTRLLADAPGATDPQVRRLLEDLELVLAQIALLSQERVAGERALIDHALEERAMMPRLRTAIPAGRPIAGT